VTFTGQLADVPPSRALTDRVLNAVETLASRPGGWVMLTRLRAALPDVPRADVDQAILDLLDHQSAMLTPEANQKTLTTADRDAAIFIGGENKHLISIDREPEPQSVPDRIREVYQLLSVKKQDWVRLAKLRPLIDAPRAEVDAALKNLVLSGAAVLAPDSNRKVLTDEDHAAAIDFGDTHHLIGFNDDGF
jgi:hypothetical protein